MDRRRSEAGAVNRGIYILEIFAAKKFNVKIKKYGGRIFQNGYYYYVGSAQKNLRQRLSRHLKKSKKIHWHIDHLTTVRTNNVEQVYLFPSAAKEFECKLANYLQNKLRLDPSINGFGNSDSDCSETHLFFSTEKIDHNHLFSLYHSMVRLIPSEIEIS